MDSGVQENESTNSERDCTTGRGRNRGAGSSWIAKIRDYVGSFRLEFADDGTPRIRRSVGSGDVPAKVALSDRELKQVARIGQDWYFDFQTELIGEDTQWVFENVTLNQLATLSKGKPLAMLAMKEILRCPYGDKTNSFARYIRIAIFNEKSNKARLGYEYDS